MVVDTSVIVAILMMEPDRADLSRKLARANSRQLSSVSYMEAGIVLTSRFGATAEHEINHLLLTARIDVAPITLLHAKLALDAFRRYGKGRHPAALNFGDCFSYALAKSSAEPLLFKGDGFARTDISVA
jgi:ribonuclease VapC